MKKVFAMLLAVTLIMSCMVVVPVSAETPDLTQDFVKTFVETTTSAQAADSLIKTQEGQENAYRLWNSNNIDGRNSTQVDTVGSGEAVTDFDGSSKWGTVTVYPTGTEITVGNEVISGVKIPAVNTKREWLDKSGLKDGDTLVVSIYAKTAEEGKKTFFNMGLIENSKTFGYNALTAEYGTTGMEIDSNWKKFAGTITIPNGFEKDGMAGKSYYTLHFGYPVPCANPAKIHVSTVYAAKAAAVDMTLSMDQAQLKIGESTTAKAQRLNQIGTSAGVSQNFTWYVTNGDRTQILTDSGITVTPGENGEATVTAGASVQSGSYAIVAVGENGEVKGLPLRIVAGEPTPTVDLTKDFVKTYEETTSTQQAADSLIKTQEGQENAYRLWNDNNITGRNSAQVNTAGEAVTDFDGSSKWSTVTVYPTGTEIADGSEVISGAKIPAENTYRDWLDKSELKDGDTIVVSIYAKTAEEGKKTFFNMGLIENSKTFGYNALTAEYGTTGMEIDSSWKKFAGTITIPNGFEQDTMAGKTYYTLHFGYPVPCANPAKIHVSTVYAAKVAVAEMQNRFEDGEAVLEKGQSKKLLTKTLNQIGTTAGLSQDFTYYVTNQDRTEVLTDSGITVTPGAAGEATVAAADTTADGIYYVVAVAPTGEVMGQRVLVGNTGSDLTEVTVYVSPDGDDGNPGTLEKPLKTLNQAKAMVQSLRGEKEIPVTVYLRGGEYALTGTFTLNEEDGGTEEAPVVYRAYEDEKVVLSGSTPYDFSKFQKVSGKMKELLPERAQEHVVVASGAELGLKPIEISVQDSGFEIEAPMMMLDGNAMNLARYPNSGIAEDWIFGEAVSPNTEKNSIPVLKLEDDTFWSWSYRPDDYVYFSYLAYGWTAGAFLGTRNADEQTVTGTTTSYYGTSSGNKKATRVFNAYEAIDEPGEWYYDKGEDKLYVYPFEDTGTDSKLYVTEGTFDLVSLKNTDYVSFEGITFTSSRGVGVSMNGTDHCVINNCNLINFRNRAAKIENATYCGIQNSQVSYCGTSMLYISGGDTETLTSGHNFVVNNVIHDGTKLREFNVPGVTVRGVGTRIANNEFYNFAQQTINFASAGDSATSVDTLIEYNSFHECNTNAVDLAVIYGGRDMRCHGTTIQYNHFYNISSGYNEYRFSGSAVFGDDGISDFTVTHNIVGPGCSGDNTEAFKINWGHGNVITDNLVIDLPTMFYMYNFKNFVERVNEQAANAATAPGETGATLTQVWANPLYQERWPWIKAFYEGNGYYVPNEIARNILIYTDNVPHSVSGWAAFNNSWYVHNNGKVGSDEPEINGFTTNLVILKSADRDNRDLFYDYANGDYRLKEEVLQQVPGFSNIDQSEIGLSTFSYDGQELLPGGEKPTVSNVGLSALPKVSKELQATYTYADADGDAEGATYVNFYIADKADESFYLNWKKVSDNTTTNQFTVTSECEGKYLKAKVVPVDANGNHGTAVWSDAVYVEAAGSADKEALYSLCAQAKEILAAAVIGDQEGQYPQKEADLLQAAIDSAEAVIANQKATQYQVDQEQAALEKALKRFKSSQNIAETAERIVLNPLLESHDQWVKKIEPADFGEDHSLTVGRAEYDWATYTGKPFKNTIFSFRYTQTVSEGGWGGIYFAQSEQNVYPWATTGVLLCLKADQVELQLRDGSTACSEEAGTMIVKKGAYFENGTTYDITVGMYDVSSSAVRIVMTVNGEVLFDETKALSGLVSKEGYIGFVNSPGTTVTVSPINVDKTELKQAIDSANALLQDAEAGTEYGQYPAEQLEALKKEVENSQKIFDSEYTSTDGAQKAAASLEDLYQELKDAVGTVKIFTQDEAVDMIDWVPELKFIINAGVKKPVLKMTPGENLVPQIRSEADGVTMELAAGTVLTGRNWNGELQLSVKGDSPSGTSASSAKLKEVYSLGSSVPVQADQWVKIVLTGQKSARIAYLNEQGTYTTVKTMPSSGDLSNVTIYRTTEGNDAVIYTKLLTELVSYEITEPSPSPVPTVEPVIPGNGGGSSGGIYTGAINQGTEQPTEASSFTDIIGHWAEKDINDLYQKGIVAGVTATTFEPDREITRAEFATLIVKALKLTGNPQGIFEDVEQGAWYTSYVNLAAEAGLIQGYDGKFRPEDTITRQEAAVIAVKAYEFLGKEATSKELSFTDASDIQPWAKDYVEKSVGAGIISGMTDGSFAPLACTTRAQAVAILKRIL